MPSAQILVVTPPPVLGLSWRELVCCSGALNCLSDSLVPSTKVCETKILALQKDICSKQSSRCFRAYSLRLSPCVVMDKQVSQGNCLLAVHWNDWKIPRTPSAHPCDVFSMGGHYLSIFSIVKVGFAHGQGISRTGVNASLGCMQPSNVDWRPEFHACLMHLG